MRRGMWCMGGLAGAAVLALAPRAAHAFCGFYVSGAGTKLFNNATQVVLMRDGQRTVLSMQNNYEGPPENFAMVVPVPVVLEKDNVKTLPRAIFDRVDQLTSPRLVEYWEQDPCIPPAVESVSLGGAFAFAPTDSASARGGNLGVKIEAQFTVGEYEVVILSAQDSTGLDKWLHLGGYKIPDGAEPYLRPYVQQGSKFFVAKVDPAKVTFDRGQAMLSPLRFHYDAERFTLPIRLGLINSHGTQDLVVTILARGQRYEASNYENTTIPTNLDVADEARGAFGAMYASLFDRTLEAHPRAVVTEYAWDAMSCDPCPTPPLEPAELATLGADVLPGGAKTGAASQRPSPPAWSTGSEFVVTRLHARYSRDALGDDLVFRAAPAIAGGREWTASSGTLEKGASPADTNNFQARYIIRHAWTGPIACDKPVRGRWGGPPGGGEPAAQAASKIAFAPRGGVALASLVREDVPELGLVAAVKNPAFPPPEVTLPSETPSAPKPRSSACGCREAGRGAGGAGLGGASFLGLVTLFLRRRRP